LYEGTDPLFGSYLRTPGEAELWQHVTTWFLPAQLVRGTLIGLVLVALGLERVGGRASTNHELE
jgi:hypothetical protein